MAGNGWISGASGTTGAAIRLYCIPHAGGGARFFQPWIRVLAPEIEVRPVALPGRESRWREPAHINMSELVEPLFEAVRAHGTGPFALLGHSMGAAIAYELARRFEAGGGQPGPVRLLVSARPAPGLPPRFPPIHGLPPDQFLARLHLLNGTPSELMRNTELLDAFLPCLRADFRLNETYRPAPGPRLAVGVSAFVGDADPIVDPDEMLAWRALTAGEFTLRVLRGDHFYLREPSAELARAVREAVVSAAAQAALR